MRHSIWHAVVAALLLPVALQAQERRLEEILARHLYSPEMVMQRQRQLELNEDQLTRIRGLTQEFQSGVLGLRWELENKSQALAEMVGNDHVDLDAALAQMDLVLALESQIKRAHLRLLVEIRNILTPPQRAILQRVMEELLRRREGENHLERR